MLRNISRLFLARQMSTRRPVDTSRFKKTQSKKKHISENFLDNPIPPVLVKHAVEDVNVKTIQILHLKSILKAFAFFKQVGAELTGRLNKEDIVKTFSKFYQRKEVKEAAIENGLDSMKALHSF